MKNSVAKHELIVQKTITAQADRLQVWEALTNPKITKKYFFGCEVHSTWKIGSPITWTGTFEGQKVEVKGTVLKMQPGRLLQYTAWSKMSGLEDIPSNYTTVSIHLVEVNGMTSIALTDENFGSDAHAEKRHQASVAGWDKVLSGLKGLFIKQ